MGAKSKLITVVPVFNGAEYILQTLQSVANQTQRPDRLIIIDNCSTDNTQELVEEFRAFPCSWRQNEKNLGLFGNCNRALEFADQTEYLHLLCADDVIKPEFYATLIHELESCKGFGLGYCLDERIDENNERLSISGKDTGKVEIQAVANFMREKAEISNQAFSGSLLKTAWQKSPCQFRLDFPILADVIFWADWGRHCEKIVRVHQALCQYRWHGTNVTSHFAAQLQSLILDEWRVMEMVEKLRGASPGFVRRFKLKGLFAVRSGIKAKRFRQQKDFAHASQITQAARNISGPLAWYLAQALVEARDLAVYKIGGRRRHPKNVYG
jgi:glycosyltransferase involved in cell wall biosynthesis